MTKGEQVRDFINVTDVARRFVNELDFLKTQNGVPQFENVGSGKTLMLWDFSEFWWKKWNAKGKLLYGSVPYRENEIMRLVPKISNK